MLTQPTICIITPNYISGTPRVVKEADALSHAGYNVRVVFSQGNIERNRLHDADLLVQKPWHVSSFAWSPDYKDEQLLFHFSRLRHYVARRLPISMNHIPSIAEIAHGRVFPELAHAAASEPADLYIGHYPDGLSAAAFAAKRNRALLAYDFEDFHIGEGNGPKVCRRVEIIERRYLGRCIYTSAASELMSAALADHYNISNPLPIYNVFPWSDRQTLDGQIRDRRGEALSIYWYSQTIGLDRGIQDAIRAAGLVDVPIQIHLRGALSQDVQEALLSLAAECNIAQHIYFHKPVSPIELLSRAVEHDIGLAGEQPVDINRQITATNKLFFYLLAGLCIAATDVPGQRRVMETIPDAGVLYPVGDHVALAGFLKRMAENPDELRRHKQAALSAARDRWNWEIESQKLVETVSTVLNNRSERSLL